MHCGTALSFRVHMGFGVSGVFSGDVLDAVGLRF